MRLKTPFSLKPFLPRSLFGRSLLILIIPVLLIQIVMTVVFFDRHWNKMLSRLAYAVSGEIAVISSVIESSPPPERIQNLVSYTAQSLDLLVSYTPDGAITKLDREETESLWGFLIYETLKKELSQQISYPFVIHVDYDDRWVSVDVELESGLLNVSFPQRRLFSSSGYIFLLWVIGTSLVLLVIAIIFMRNQIRPIRKLAAAAERFGKGRDVMNFKPEGAYEVRQAAEAFINMHRRIKRQVEQRTAMLAGVSHDLRTPLTRLKLQLSMMGGAEDVEAMKGDIHDMEKMIGGYLDFVRGEGDEDVQAVIVGDLLNKVANNARALGLDVTVTCPSGLEAALRPMAFERCLMNIAANAARHAGSLEIKAWGKDGYLQLSMADDGPGIPEEKYDDVFRPFYRIDDSRNLETGGVGLGLSIAMDIAHGHGGTIWVEKSDKGGADIRIRIPL